MSAEHDCYENECGSQFRALENERDHYKEVFESSCRGVAEILERTGLYKDLPPDLWTLHTAVCKLRQQKDTLEEALRIMTVRVLAIDPEDTRDAINGIVALQADLSKAHEAVILKQPSVSESEEP
jgi:hypothetical protein